MGATSFEMENMRAMADPALRVRFSLSFAGQMMLSGEEVKEYCAAAVLRRTRIWDAMVSG